jgi:hypothetical protein
MLTLRVPRVTSRAGIDRAAAPARRVLRDMRRDPERPRNLDKVVRVIALVGADRSATPRRSAMLGPQHQHAGIALRQAVSGGGHRVDNQSIAVLDQQVTQVGEAGLAVVRSAVELRVGIGRRRVRVVRPRLAAEVAPVPVGAAVLPLKTLLARPRLDEGAIDREVLVRHQAGRAVEHPTEEAARNLLIQQPVAVFREDRRRPDRFVHLEPDEPAKQDVVVELLHQEPLTTNRIEDLQQLRAQQALRRHRWLGCCSLRLTPRRILSIVPAVAWSLSL